MRSATTRLTILALGSGFLLACAGLPLQIEDIPITAEPSQEISRLDQRLEKSREADVQILAPTWFARAVENLEGARDTRSEGGAVDEILQHVAEGLAELKRAEELARISRATLPRAIEARAGARAAGAPSLGEPYSAVEKRFLELTRAVENDNANWAQNRQEAVANAFRDVELQAIKDSTLGEVRELIAKARERGAAKAAPKTLAEAESELADVESFISQNRYARSRANEMAQQALFQAQRLSHATAEARRLESTSPEALYLDDVQRLDDLATALGLPDMRNQSVATRRAAVANSAKELVIDRNFLVTRTELLRSEIDDAQSRIARLEGETAAEQREIARLEAERRFNQLYSEVSAYFEPEEAEVYKQGQQLVIRLRKVQFPVGEHVLQPDSYQLLTKVQRAVRAFGTPRVVIEGHTDATGSAELNDHLSALRANAVREYLVANQTLAADRVTAVGLGFSEPLASNRTSEGRAQNRRIDVTIDATLYDGAGELPAVSSPPPPLAEQEQKAR